MGFNARQNARTYGTVDQVLKQQEITANRSVYWGEGCTTDCTSKQYADVASPPTVEECSNSFSINNNQTKYNNCTTEFPCDTTIYFRAYGYFEKCLSGQEETYSSIETTKMYAVDPTLDDVPTLDNETSTSVRINNGSTDSYTPATVESEVDLYIQYKESSAGTWTTWGTALKTDQTGYTDDDCGTTTITGLTADTSYDFRYYLDRSETTNGTTAYYSSTSTTSTLPDDPEVTTQAATLLSGGISGTPNDGSATLNAEIDNNNQYPAGDTEYRFVWATTPTGGTYGSATSWYSAPLASEVENVAKAAVGLAESTEYGFRAEIRWNSGTETANGSELTFTVPADPQASAAQESQCTRKEVTAKRKTATSFYFHARNVAANGVDSYVTAATPFSSSAVYLFKDGSYDSDLTNSVLSQVQAIRGLYAISLTADNLDCNYADIIITDDGTNHADIHIKVLTEINLGNVDIDAAQNTNTSALKLTGSGTAHGLEAIGGATGNDIDGLLGEMTMLHGTIASSADSSTVTLGAEGDGANDDIYNGNVILFYTGAGAGQARVIEDYDSGTKACTLNKALGNYTSDPVDNTTGYVMLDIEDMFLQGAIPGAELSTFPTYADSYADMLQAIFQRVAYKRTETATVHSMYNEAGDTVEFQYGTDNDGTIETKNKTEDA